MLWAYLVHSVTGGKTLVPDDPSVVLRHEVLGWERHVAPDGVDLNDVRAPDVLAELSADTERILSEDEALELKGKALDEALDVAGLSKEGSADEKRARLAAHEAELADTTSEEGDA